jgi:hypothetical protein
MPSNAFTVHLVQLLQDADDLDDAHSRLKTGKPGRQYRLASLNRAALVISVSAWESNVEELMRECLLVLHAPPAPPLDPWPALNAYVLGLLGRFHTPNSNNVTNLIDNCLGLPSISSSWTWQNCTPAQAAARLDAVLDFRHQIAHGVNPRPPIHNTYSAPLPLFFRKLALCTDRAARAHLVGTLGIATPWPP